MRVDQEPARPLKGEEFAERIRRICEAPPPPQPLAGRRYQRFLVPGLIGGEIQFALLGLIAQALRLRGADVTALLCNQFLPACTMKKVDHVESACTRWCHRNIGPFVRAAGLPHRWYSEFITPAEAERCVAQAAAVAADEIADYVDADLPLGRLVVRSLENYYRVGHVDPTVPDVPAQARRFLSAALQLVVISHRALDTLRIDKVFMDDGTKIDWGVLRAVAAQHHIPVDVIPGGTRGACLLIEQDQPGRVTDVFPQWPQWRHEPLTVAQAAQLDAYFAQRAVRPYADLHWTAVAPEHDEASVRRILGLPARRGGLVLGIFPNLGFDCAVTARAPAYASAATCVADTIRLLQRWPQHHLIIKTHPAERLLAARDPTLAFLEANIAAPPPNVHILPPETPLTAHDVLRRLDLALVYTSTVSVEAAYLGRPVINVGGGWHAGRGISVDVTTPAEFRALLGQVCATGHVPPVDQELGRRYAYAVFFRGVLPIRHYRAAWPHLAELHTASLAELLPGRDATIDRACRTILCDAPFGGESLW